MKIKEGFMLRDIAGNFVVVPVGKASKDFNGVINLNPTGAFLWKKLITGATTEELINNLMEEYEVNIDVATLDTNTFIENLKEASLLE